LLAEAKPLLRVTMTPGIGAPVACDVIVPVTVPQAVALTQLGNRYDATRVDQLKAPVVFKYSFV
jgi:hypothetical protein